VYGAAIALRNRKFDGGNGAQAFDRPVISIGNITTGGTGKTPLVAWLARQLIEARVEPLIAMRGYGARHGEVSDEQAEYRATLPDPHVVANPKRASAIREYLESHLDVQAIVLDDGFQHRQIKRDLDLVLIDATADTFEDRLLPAGNLREPVANLHRADAVIVTHADFEISDLNAQVERHHGRPPIAWCRHVWTHLDFFDRSSRPESVEVNWLRGKRIITMLGIGRPASVQRQLHATGAQIVKAIPARDHQKYDHDSLNAVLMAGRMCDALVVTHKDWVKLAKVIDWEKFSLPIVVPRLAIEFDAGEMELLNLVLQRVRMPGGLQPARSATGRE
jgi:tetraacyldisaccharide 4'-kinase